MVYKKKLTVLTCIIALLAVTYILTFILDPQRRGSRSDMYTWLDPGMKDRITGITIATSMTEEDETVQLERKDGAWFVIRAGKQYPAKQTRIEDFIETLVKRASYPVRSSSVSAHERFSLTEDAAARVTIAGGPGMPLLSLLLGERDMAGQIYMRKLGNNEVRSGEDVFSMYAHSAAQSWFNLRLFPEFEAGKLVVSDVQGVEVHYPPEARYPSEEADEEDDEESEDAIYANVTAPDPLIITRSNREWTFSLEPENPDMTQVNSYIQRILNTEGNDFSDEVTASDPRFNHSQIILRLGNGSARTIRVAPPDDDNRYLATVSGSDMVYVLPFWAADQLFPNVDYFELN